MNDKFIPGRIVVTAYPKMTEALREAAAISEHLKQMKIDAPHGSLNDEGLRRRVREGAFDMLIAVGGDGTMLRAGHLCGPYGVPILGVNQGRLGFLYQSEADGWRGLLAHLFEGRGWIENRMMLRAEHIRAGESLGAWHALNDVVVGRGLAPRPVRVSASLDGHFLTALVADGLIAATATGSTAYALAAGGPILPPELRNILLVPIAPHLSFDRAVVLSEGTVVTMAVQSENAFLSVDGQSPLEMAEEDHVNVRAGDYAVKFVRFGDPGYFYRNLTAHMNQNPSIVGLPR